MIGPWNPGGHLTSTGSRTSDGALKQEVRKASGRGIHRDTSASGKVTVRAEGQVPEKVSASSKGVVNKLPAGVNNRDG